LPTKSPVSQSSHTCRKGRFTGTATFIRDYLNTVVEHDISVVSGGRRDPRLVRRFLHAYARLTAQPARLSTIVERARSDGGRAEDAPGPTRGSAEAYLRALGALMIVDEVEAWAPALRSRTRFTSVPKRHLVDPSLAASLMGAALGPESTHGRGL
jgi:predicted AAA+ superfamily ATPase